MNARTSAKADPASTQAAAAPWPRGDAADALLAQLRLSGVVYCRSELSAPWGLSMPAMPGCMAFHVVSAGQCRLAGADTAVHVLQAGDVALVTRGTGHSLSSDAQAPVPDLFSLPRQAQSPWYEWLRHGGGGPPTALLCGAVRFHDAVSARLLAELPPVLVLRGAQLPEQDWLLQVLARVATEAARPGPGAEAMMTRLADIVVLQVLRHWLASQPPRQQGWVAALQDRHVGRAMQCLSTAPAQAWTLAALAREVGLSRSALAARFQRLLGCPPMAYLTEQRLLRAQALLRGSPMTLAEVAERCGYSSEAAFSRAFKRFNGRSPGAARRPDGGA